MTLSEYVSSLHGKKIGVVGIGVSNEPLIRLLCFSGCDVTACDARPIEKMGMTALKLVSMGAKLRLGPEYLDRIGDFDVIFRTPGLMPFEPHLAAAKARGSILTSEMEVFFQVCPCRTIAVTGSDGKTTTSTIIAELLKAAGYTVHLGGNIGHPLLCEAPMMKKTDVAVLELSSFQLHSMQCRPDIAVITNVSPNHLDKHGTYEDYVQAKKSIFLNQTPENVLILNQDDPVVYAFSRETASQVRSFSVENPVAHGTYLKDGVLYRVVPKDGNGSRTTENPEVLKVSESLRGSEISEGSGRYEGSECPKCAGNSECSDISEISEILKASEILLPGLHNVKNFLAAFAATETLVSDELCRKAAMEFHGVEHRLETVRQVRGVTYINDSIATSPARTVAGLRALKKKPVLILGGYDKGVPFAELADEVCGRAKAVVLTGATAGMIDRALKVSTVCADSDKPPVYHEPEFDDAVRKAAALASEGDTVLFSPACASFDCFKNFEERGLHFKNLVSDLEQNG